MAVIDFIAVHLDMHTHTHACMHIRIHARTCNAHAHTPQMKGNNLKCFEFNYSCAKTKQEPRKQNGH
jgi:hypothetical protein